MTNQQIEYWKNMESKRHNFAMEKLTGEQNAEVVTHNRASEQIGYMQASAAQTQAAAAWRQALVQERLSQLQELRTEYDIQIARHQMDYLDSQTSNMKANAELTKAKTAYQTMDNAVFALWGSRSAAADYKYTRARAAESTAHTSLMQSQRKVADAQAFSTTAQGYKQSVETASDIWDLLKSIGKAIT